MFYITILRRLWSASVCLTAMAPAGAADARAVPELCASVSV